MAHVIYFPDHAAFRQGLEAISRTEHSSRVLEVPRFCSSLVAPSILISGVGSTAGLKESLAGLGIPMSGIVPYAPFKRMVPDAAPPDSGWQPILGALRLECVRPSLTDHLRLRVEVTWDNELGDYTRRMARLIRGGSYRPEVPSLAFEEERRLVAILPRRLVLCRADDMLDAWIQLRTFIDLLCATAVREKAIKPDTKPRRGIGTIEVFKRLPGTNCGRCGCPNCMEFAMRLFMGRSRVEECAPLFEPDWTAHREAVTWLMDLIGQGAPEPTPERPSGNRF